MLVSNNIAFRPGIVFGDFSVVRSREIGIKTGDIDEHNGFPLLLLDLTSVATCYLVAFRTICWANLGKVADSSCSLLRIVGSKL